MPDHRKLLLISVLVLTALFFIEYFFIHDNLPAYIPHSPINITGLYIITSLSAVYYLVFRKILKQNPELSIAYLVVFGSLIAMFSEVIFQFYRQFTFDDISNAERMRFFFKGVIGIPIYASVIGLTIALDAKYKNRWINTLVIIGFLVIFYYANPYLMVILKS